MASFVLTPAPQASDGILQLRADQLGRAVLVHNVQWFIQLRWLVVATLLLGGIATAFLPVLITHIGMPYPCYWPWLLASLLAVANTGFWWMAQQLTEATASQIVASHLWLQIGVDLLIVTLLVHYVGSISTFIAFTYLFHIALACLFFAPRQSLLVTLLAATLYLSCVFLESTHVWPSPGMPSLGGRGPVSMHRDLLYAGSAIFVWLVVWYLISSLSRTVRDRDRMLETANQQLRTTNEEKNKLMLHTAHDLKAPFSGIECNIQQLKLQHWDQIPEPVQGIINRIELRGQTLSDRIRDILFLGNMRISSIRPNLEPVALDQILQEVSRKLDGSMQARQVRLQIQTAPLTVQGCARNYFALISNILGNAIMYSQAGGTVSVDGCQQGEQICLRIRDQGIGISASALPHIFDDYFRSTEAAQSNPHSTGLGLAIAKEIAQQEGLTITVESQLGAGTTFTIAIPANRCEWGKGGKPWPAS